MSDNSSKLAELKARRAEKDAKRAAEREANEILELELEEKYEAETSGARGREFEIIDATDLGEGLIVLKRGEPVYHKRFLNSKQTEADLAGYVTPSVAYPDKEAYVAIVGRRPALAIRCGQALATLYGVKKGEDAGKF